MICKCGFLNITSIVELPTYKCRACNHDLRQLHWYPNDLYQAREDEKPLALDKDSIKYAEENK